MENNDKENEWISPEIIKKKIDARGIINRAKPKKNSKRGYSSFILISLEPMKAVIWHVFSVKIKPHAIIKLGRKWKNATETQLHVYFEQILNSIRTLMEEGMRSLFLVSPDFPELPNRFSDHLKNHHKWLFQVKHDHALSWREKEESIRNLDEAYQFVLNEENQKMIISLLNQEAESIISLLDNHLKSEKGIVMYSIPEVERLLLPKKKYRKTWAEYLIVTDQYLENATPKQKNHLNRLFSIANNKGVKQRIIDSESPSGNRLKGLGGMACFLEIDSRFEMI